MSAVQKVSAENRTEAPKRFRASGPILLLAILFVIGAFLTWYFTWFGRELSDADISQYLSEVHKPRHVQHALLQIQQRIERRDPAVKQWYPHVIRLAGNAETELRSTTAWLMGFDNQSKEFHETLMKLLQDKEPIVRRNAALALVRFGDSSGRNELRSILSPYQVVAPAGGTLLSSLNSDSPLTRGTLLARLRQTDGQISEIRSPLPGKIEKLIVQGGQQLETGAAILTIAPDEASIWEALRGLALIGEAEDVAAIRSYLANTPTVAGRIKEQAALTMKSIEGRLQKK